MPDLESSASTPETYARPVLSDISVVIPTLGRALLEDCLRSISVGGAWPAHLIIVDQGDNASVARWVEVLRSAGLQVEHVHSERRGIGVGMNRGVERVRTPFLAVTHDDCRVAASWLERLVTRVRRAPHAIVTGRVEPEGTEQVPSVNTSAVPRTYCRPLVDRDVLFPANMGAATSVVRRIGPFDEDPRLATAAEDNEWSYRALRSGVPIMYAPEVVVRHVGWRDASQRAAVYRSYAHSQGVFYGKYLRRGDAFIGRRALFDVLRGPWMLLRGKLTGDGELRSIGRAYVTMLPKGILAGLRRGPRQNAGA